MSVGDNIQRLRKERKLTQASLAKKANISEISIRKYESGDRAPKIETLIKIAEALDCEVSDIDENIIVHRQTIRLGPSPEDIERYKKNAEAEKLNQKKALGENISEDEQKKIDDYIEYKKKWTALLPERIKERRNKIDKIGENILLADYRKLNTNGKSEARKRISELTEIPRYIKSDEPPQD